MKTEDLKKIVARLAPLSDITIVFETVEIRKSFVGLMNGDSGAENFLSGYSYIDFAGMMTYENGEATLNNSLIILDECLNSKGSI